MSWGMYFNVAFLRTQTEELMQMLHQHWFAALQDIGWDTVVPRRLSAGKAADSFAEVFLC